MTEKKKKHHGIVGKTIAFIFLILGFISMPVGIFGTYTIIQEGFFLADAATVKQNLIAEEASEIGKVILYHFVNNGITYAESYADEKQCQFVVKENGMVQGGNATGDRNVLWSGSFVYGKYEAGRYVFENIGDYEITVYLLKRSVPDEISWTFFIADKCQVLRVVLPLMAVVGLILVISSYVGLLCMAGGRNEKNEPTAGMFGKIPTDVFTLLIFVLGYGWYQFTVTVLLLENIGIVIGLTVGYFLLFVIWSMSIAARSRAKTLWPHMVLAKLWKWGKHLGKGVLSLLVKIPLIWKTICGVVVISLLEFLFILVMYSLFKGNEGLYILWLIFWGLEKVVLLPFILVVALRLKALQKAGYELAEGNLNYQVNTKELFWDLKEHGENLNHISEGVNKAVQERMKSEHFKTELITNVSHDIKTPLTSIINYSDLLCKEETDNEKIKEYSDVLHRQSVRLKKLIEDLVEASKASTGSIEVNLEVCEVGVLLEQAQGEFEGRLYEKNMDVITKIPENPVKIMADGKHLWRVFDNLFNNICKYAQNGTRVYITVEDAEEKVIITFKNISEYPLDITADELMERFVRGDKSRHTEGNGLGLNIAKSLTELQNGSLELVIDGDLFKVILTFPTVK